MKSDEKKTKGGCSKKASSGCAGSSDRDSTPRQGGGQMSRCPGRPLVRLKKKTLLAETKKILILQRKIYEKGDQLRKVNWRERIVVHNNIVDLAGELHRSQNRIRHIKNSEAENDESMVLLAQLDLLQHYLSRVPAVIDLAEFDPFHHYRSDLPMVIALAKYITLLAQDLLKIVTTPDTPSTPTMATPTEED